MKNMLMVKVMKLKMSGMKTMRIMLMAKYTVKVKINIKITMG